MRAGCGRVAAKPTPVNSPQIAREWRPAAGLFALFATKKADPRWGPAFRTGTVIANFSAAEANLSDSSSALMNC
jgi:urea transporter